MNRDIETTIGEPHRAVIRSRYVEGAEPSWDRIDSNVSWPEPSWDRIDSNVSWPERTKRIHRETKRVDPALRPQRDQVLKNAHHVLEAKVKAGKITPQGTHDG